MRSPPDKAYERPVNVPAQSRGFWGRGRASIRAYATRSKNSPSMCGSVGCNETRRHLLLLGPALKT